MTEARVTVESFGIDVDVGHATRRWQARTGFTVRIVAGDHVGEGEVVPLPGYTTDDAGLERELMAFHETPIELDDGMLHRFDACSASARFALSTASLDLLAKERGLPLHAYLGSTRASVPISMLLPIEDESVLVEGLAHASREGISAFKIKMGRDIERELASVARVRALAPAASIRVDANGAFPIADVERILVQLAALDVLYVEEPVVLADLEAVPKWPLPVALDESLPRLTNVTRQRWLSSGALGALVLKPAILGGIDRALALAHVAASFGVGASASHLFDGPIGLAAAAELALALPIPLAAGVAPHAALAAFSARSIAAFGAGELRAHRTPGLGLGAQE